VVKSTNNELLQLFEKHITEAAKEAAEQLIASKPGWFTASKGTLMGLISKRNDTLKDFMKKESLDSQEVLKRPDETSSEKKRKDKRKWQSEFAEKFQQKDFCANPNEAFQNHHRPFMQKDQK
jgi:hypothetical protein